MNELIKFLAPLNWIAGILLIISGGIGFIYFNLVANVTNEVLCATGLLYGMFLLNDLHMDRKFAELEEKIDRLVKVKKVNKK